MTKPANGPTVFPATMWQKYVLDEACHPRCPDDLRNRMVLANALLVHPGIDARRLKRAIKRVLQRHDTLRIRFTRTKGVWRVQIDPQGGDVLRHADLGDVDDATFRVRITEIANAPMSLVDSPLIDICLVSCGARGDALVIRVHHAITDGYGMIVLAEDLAKLMIGLPLTGTPVSHAEYLANFENPPAAQAADFEAFWRDLHKDFPRAPDVGRKAKGRAPLLDALGEVDQRHMTFEMRKADLKRLDAQASAANCGATTVLSAAYLESLCQCYDLERLMFLATVSRTNPALRSFAGAHLQKPVIPYRAQGEGQLPAAAKALGETLIQVMAHLPADAGRHNSAYRAAMIEKGAYPTQFSILQPRPVSRQKQSVFGDFMYGTLGEVQQFGAQSLSAIDISAPHRVFADLELDVGAARERSGFTINYDGMSYTDDEIRKLGETMRALLAQG